MGETVLKVYKLMMAVLIVRGMIVVYVKRDFITGKSIVTKIFTYSFGYVAGYLIINYYIGGV